MQSVAPMHTIGHNWDMAFKFDWSEEKNQRLIEQRGVSFESIVASIEGDGLLDVVEHRNQDRYPGQWMYVVEINKYVHLVPFVRQGDGTSFLKTIIPNSKATREYGRRGQT